MTPKQERFCQEYVIDLNATRAAIRAGYSRKTARFIAAENLSKPNIKQAIAELQREFRERLEVTRESVTQQLREDRDLAYKQGQAAAAVQATVSLAKLHGLMVDKRKVEFVDDITEEQLDREIADLLEQLGDDEPSITTKH